LPFVLRAEEVQLDARQLAMLTSAITPLRKRDGSATSKGVDHFALNGIDRYFVAHNYPGLHFAIIYFLDIDAPLDAALLTQTVDSLIDEQPLLRSYVVERPWRAERRVAPRGRFSAADVLELRSVALAGDEEMRFVQRPIALGAAPPWRLAHYPHGDGFRLVLTVHHSMVDGGAGAALFNLIVSRYNERRAGRAPTSPPTPTLPYRFRALLGRRGWRWLGRMILRHGRPLEQMGVQNASLLDRESFMQGEIAIRVVHLGPSEWAALGRVAERSGCTRNDLLVTAALRSADHGRRAIGKPDRPLRVLLPTDLRPALGLGPSFQNCIGNVRAHFTPEEVRGPGLLERVSARIKLGRSLDEAVESPVNLALISNLLPPALFRWSLRRFDGDPRSHFFSFLFSNVRVPDGGVLPDGVTTRGYFMMTTVPRQPGFGYLVANRGDRVAVTLQYQKAALSEASAERYERVFLSELRRFVAEEPGATTTAAAVESR
jgi:hypothetical protein